MYPGTHSAKFPGKPAVVLAGTGQMLTYGELEERSRRLARFFYDAGLRPGDHLALLTGNDPKAFEVYWAAMRSGLYFTAVNRHLAPAEVGYVVNDCGARAIVVSAALADVAERIVPDTPGVRIRLVYQGEVPGHSSYEDALDSASAEPLPSQPCGIDMLYSSGTTGRPKGIKLPLPQRQVDEPGDGTAGMFGPMFGIDADTVYLSPAPIYHAAPLRFSHAVHALGGTVVLMPRFEPEDALAAIERHRVTHSQWVPTMFVRLLKLDEPVRQKYDLSSQRVAIHAAAPCPVAVKQAMIDWWGPILSEYYSSTEGAGFTFITSEQWLAKPGSVGRSASATIHICADDGTELPVGGIGTVYFGRDQPSFAYHNDVAKTERARHPDHPNWSTTGDIGYVDEDGFLFLTDRKAFMIISGGVNVYPQEIEDSLALHPHVFDVAVIGVPDEEMGESVLAVVHPAPGIEGGAGLAAELRAYLRERIAHYKVPRAFDFTEDLPRTPTGKLVKGRLRDRYL
jgi:fatty-acyl-CoA synthase